MITQACDCCPVSLASAVRETSWYKTAELKLSAILRFCDPTHTYAKNEEMVYSTIAIASKNRRDKCYIAALNIIGINTGRKVKLIHLIIRKSDKEPALVAKAEEAKNDSSLS